MALDPRSCDLVSLALLASVATTGSIGAGAERQGLSQPAASARLRELETTLGVTLLQRGSQGSRPTPTGTLVIEWSQPLLQAAATLQGALSTLHVHGTQQDPVRVAASTTVAEYLMPRWLGTLRDEHPSARAVLAAGNSAQVLRRLRAGTTDIGFAEGTVIPRTLHTRTIAHDELVLVVPPEHPWATRPTIAPTELATAPLVTRESGSGSRSLLNNALRNIGAPITVPTALEVSSTTAIKSAITSGAGIGVLSRLAVEPDLKAGTLITVPIEHLNLHRQLQAVWAPDHPLTHSAESLLDIAGRDTNPRQPQT